MSTLVSALVCSLACSLFGASVAQASTPEQAAAADALFKEARALLKDNQTTAACAKFAESQQLDPQIGTLANLATCHAADGKVAAAYVELTELAERAAATNDKQRVQFAEKRLAELKTQIVSLKVTVEGAAPDEKVFVGGREVTKPMWDRTLVYDPGAIEVSASAPSRTPWKVKLVAPPGAPEMLVVVPGLAEESHVAVGPPAPALPPPAAEGGGKRTAAIVAFGVGVVGLTLGAAFGLSAISSKSAADDACPRDPCTPENVARYKSGYDDAKSSAVVSTVGFGVAAVALAAGIYLLLSAPSAVPSAPRAARSSF